MSDRPPLSRAAKVVGLCALGALALAIVGAVVGVTIGDGPPARGVDGRAPAVEHAAAPVSRVIGLDADDPDLVERSTKLVTAATEKGLIVRWTCTGNEAYVRELLWMQFNIDQKRGFGRALAVVCHAQRSGRYIAIKGYQTGRTLATFKGDALSVE